MRRVAALNSFSNPWGNAPPAQSEKDNMSIFAKLEGTACISANRKLGGGRAELAEVRETGGGCDVVDLDALLQRTTRFAYKLTI